MIIMQRMRIIMMKIYQKIKIIMIKNFYQKKTKFYKLPLKEKIIIKNIFENNENNKLFKMKKEQPFDDSDEKILK